MRKALVTAAFVLAAATVHVTAPGATATGLDTVSPGIAVLFENPQHDFPQRVGYRSSGPDTMLAWIEGTAKGKSRKLEFPYRRVPCARK